MVNVAKSEQWLREPQLIPDDWATRGARNVLHVGPSVQLCKVSSMVADLRDCYLHGSGTVFATMSDD